MSGKYPFLAGMEELDLPKEELVIEDPEVVIEDPEETPTPVKEPEIENTEIIAGTEDFCSYYGIKFLIDKEPTSPIMAGSVPSREPDSSLLIRTSDYINFRIYFKAEHFLTEQYITRLCRFLDSRTPEQTVTFYMGCKIHSRFTIIIGAILSAVISCPAQTYAVAAGCCGIPESMIWLFCRNRSVEKYGGLTFGGTDSIQHAPFYQYYLETCFDRAKELGVLNEEEIKTLWDNKGEILVAYADYKSRGF